VKPNDKKSPAHYAFAFPYMWAKRQRLLDFSWAPLKIGIENSRDLPLCVEMGVGMVMAVGIGIKGNCFSPPVHE